MDKRYLGDGVYVQVVDGMLKLTTEDGVMVGNTIYLDPDVMTSLLIFYREAQEFYAAKRKGATP